MCISAKSNKTYLQVQVKEEPHENNADKDYQLPAEAEQPGSRRYKNPIAT